MTRFRKLLICASALSPVLAAAPAVAQEAPAAAPASPNAMTNLIRLLVEQKVVTAQAGEALMAQAEAEAAAARSQVAAAPPPPAEGTVRVAHVPQVVKDEIREELRKEVVQQAKAEGWVAPNAMPGWLSKVKIYGEMRLRSQSNFLANTNETGLIDYAAFNENGPTDASLINPLPFLNSTVDRMSRFSIRARLGVDAQIVPGVEAGVRIASGNDDGPVTSNQILGAGFGKKDLWLDLAYLRLSPTDYASLTLGRFTNPFHSSDILFDEDLNFDGVVASIDSRRWTGDALRFKATGGAFPYEYVSDSEPATSIDKKTGDKWIFGGQLSASYDEEQGVHGRLSAGYYDFVRVQGQLSSPCPAYLSGAVCDTDFTRPRFLSKGNTLMLLRSISPNPDASAAPVQPQFVGLNQDYNILHVEADTGYDLDDDLRFTLGGSFIMNLAYDKKQFCTAGPLVTNVTGVDVNAPAAGGGTLIVTNFDPCNVIAGSTSLNGGPLTARVESGRTGWMVRTGIGSKALEKAKQWNVGVSYKWIQPDATIDALVDDNFHLGGTNAKGYTLSGNYMLFDNVRLTGRYMSATEIYGPQLSLDVLQIDLLARF